VSRFCSCFTLRLGQDLVGWFGPFEWLAAFVPAVDEGADRGDEIFDRCEAATPDGVPLGN
jgi:hypothetical protein